MKLKNVIRIKKLQKMLVLQNDLGITKDAVYPDGAVESMLGNYRELIWECIQDLIDIEDNTVSIGFDFKSEYKDKIRLVERHLRMDWSKIRELDL